MRAILLSLLLFVSLSAFSQISFEKAYFIDNNGLKTECLIKNMDWVSNPGNFEFKLSADDIPKTMDVSSVKEFGIYDFSRYVSADVKIDRSKTKQSELTRNKEPEWSEEHLLLKVIIEGKATLYCYQDYYHTRFFYSMDNSPIEQLVFKEYVSDKDQVLPNNKFRQQLWVKIRCAGISQKSVEAMNYRQSELENYFKKYYSCTGDSYIDYNKKPGKRDLFNVRITPGINNSSIIAQRNYEWDDDFGSQINLRLGVEVEYILPFKKNKWCFVFEPSIQYFKFESENPTRKFNLRLIEYQIGLRHIFFLNEDLRLHLNAFIIPGFSTDLGSKLFLKYAGDTVLDPQYGFSLGAGMNYKKLSAEIRYYPKRNLTGTEPFNTYYQKTSLIIGYQIF